MAAMATVSHLRGYHVGRVRDKRVHEFCASTHLSWRLYVCIVAIYARF